MAARSYASRRRNLGPLTSGDRRRAIARAELSVITVIDGHSCEITDGHRGRGMSGAVVRGRSRPKLSHRRDLHDRQTLQLSPSSKISFMDDRYRFQTGFRQARA